mmetsp:Transcript_9165/g.13561  ORF Transcript_9165/g.13561 Transcript_9165/m.13561 type:complete len:1037 (+) Transcript_9165:22-3132(+)
MEKIEKEIKDIPLKIEKEPVLSSEGDGVVYSEATTTPLELVKQKVNLDISSGFAQTTQILTFKNNTNRELEGELNFNLKEGSSVISYGLDVNGQIMEAVPVTKEKAKKVFEEEIADNSKNQVSVVEQVEGNVFKTKIYPINPNGTRTVKLQVLDELDVWKDNMKKLWIPMALAKSLEQLEIKIKINENRMTRVYMREENGELHSLATTKQGEIDVNLEDIKSKLAKTEQGAMAGLFILTVDEKKEKKKVDVCLEGNTKYDYFSATFNMEKESSEKSEISKVGILLDISHSNYNATRDQSMALAKLILEDNVEVVVFPFNNTCIHSKSVKTYEEFEEFVSSFPMDGGSNIENALKAVQVGKADFNYLLLFSDGFFNVGKMPFDLSYQTPIYACPDSESCNTAVLQYMSVKSGGSYFNLHESKTVKEIKSLLGVSTRTFKGLQETPEGLELYPSIPTSLKGQNEFTVYGRIDRSKISENLKVGALFESNNKKTTIPLEFKLLENSKDGDHSVLARIWAQRKISQLQLFGDKFKEDILNVGIEYNMATPGTSLIVLEKLEQYKKHHIRPSHHHPELRAKYDEFVLANENQEKKQFEAKVTLWAKSFKEHRYETWYMKEFKIPKATVKKENSKIMPENPRPGNNNNNNNNNAFNLPTPQPVVRNLTAPPPPPATEAPQLRLMAEQQQQQIRQVEREHMSQEEEERRPRRRRSLKKKCKKSKKMDKCKKKEKKPVPQKPTFKMAAKTFDGNNEYANTIKNAEDQYKAYLGFKPKYHNSPSFYLDAVDVFLSSEKQNLATQVLYNILELGLGDVQLLRIVGYRLDQANKLYESSLVFRKVLTLSPHEPQSYRDLALVLERMGEYKEAADLLYKVIGGKWHNRFEQIQYTAIVELNHIFAMAERNKKPLSWDDYVKELKFDVDMDLRISMAWDTDLTDIDLHVIEPTKEEVYYSHNLSVIGGKISRDFTGGYGPEEYMLKKAMDGSYEVSAKYYANHSKSLTGGTTILLTFFKDYMRENEERQLVTLRMTKNQSKVHVCTVSI